MALIDEVKAEVIERNTGAVKPMEAEKGTSDSPKKRRRRRNPDDMTKEEREAWLEKKRAEEEARCLGESGKPVKKRRRRRSAEAQKPEQAAQPKKQPLRRARKSNVEAPNANRPKILQPLETLYLLRIPGLPKGDS